MNKIFFKVLFLFILTSCSYEPILTNKKYDFRYDNIYFEGEKGINKIIVKNLRKTNNGETKYDLFFKTKKTRDIVSLDKKGDPSIFSIKVNLVLYVPVPAIEGFNHSLSVVSIAPCMIGSSEP